MRGSSCPYNSSSIYGSAAHKPTLEGKNRFRWCFFRAREPGVSLGLLGRNKRSRDGEARSSGPHPFSRLLCSSTKTSRLLSLTRGSPRHTPSPSACRNLLRLRTGAVSPTMRTPRLGTASSARSPSRSRATAAEGGGEGGVRVFCMPQLLLDH